jgi:hypothetical protein
MILSSKNEKNSDFKKGDRKAKMTKNEDNFNFLTTKRI